MRELFIIFLLIVAAKYTASGVIALRAAVADSESNRLAIERQEQVDAITAIVGVHAEP